MMDRRRFLVGSAVVGTSFLAACTNDSTTDSPSQAPSTTPTSVPPSQPEPTRYRSIEPRVIETVATGLSVPWGLAFLADGSALVSQRVEGTILRVGSSAITEVGTVAGVAAQGEGGLLGLAFSGGDESTLYAYLSSATDNRVISMPFDGESLGEPTVLLSGLPLGSNHQGGQLLSDSEGFLFVSVGEAYRPELAQDLSSLGGKILRIDLAGSPAPDNPFGDEIWTYGHRNVQGLAFDSRGRLWSTEFGERAADELNLIEAGQNYGWPMYEGESSADGLVSPQVTWSPTSEASPSGLAIVADVAYVGALRGERLWTVDVSGDSAAEPISYFDGEFGRIRGVFAASEDTIWIATSNTDGRGAPGPDDDQIIAVQVAEAI